MQLGLRMGFGRQRLVGEGKRQIRRVKKEVDRAGREWGIETEAGR